MEINNDRLVIILSKDYTLMAIIYFGENFWKYR